MSENELCVVLSTECHLRTSPQKVHLGTTATTRTTYTCKSTPKNLSHIHAYNLVYEHHHDHQGVVVCKPYQATQLVAAKHSHSHLYRPTYPKVVILIPHGETTIYDKDK